MAQIQLREDLIAARYDGLPTGPGLFYSFETQRGYPVDGTNPLLRVLSPFTLRLIPPVISENMNRKAINSIGRARAHIRDQQDAASAVRSAFGIESVSGSEGGAARLSGLQQIVAGGQVVSGGTTKLTMVS